jgi:hypothetical protein
MDSVNEPRVDELFRTFKEKFFSQTKSLDSKGQENLNSCFLDLLEMTDKYED